MSPEDKKKFREAFMKSVEARPDADQCIHHRYKIRSHFLPLNWDKPCESVKEYYEKQLAGDEIYEGVDRALARIKQWQEEDAKKAAAPEQDNAEKPAADKKKTPAKKAPAKKKPAAKKPKI